MAHFAELDPDALTVLRVVVIAADDCLDTAGQHSEAIGATFCAELLGGVWIETSYDAEFRGKYAGAGDTYDPELDEFTPAPTPDPVAPALVTDLPADLEAALIAAGWLPPA